MGSPGDASGGSGQAKESITLLSLTGFPVSCASQSMPGKAHVRSTADDPGEVIVALAELVKQGKLGNVRWLCPSVRGASYPCPQFGIQFIQIGNDEGATAFLTNLDNNLKQEHGIKVRTLQPMVFTSLPEEKIF